MLSGVLLLPFEASPTSFNGCAFDGCTSDIKGQGGQMSAGIYILSGLVDRQKH